MTSTSIAEIAKAMSKAQGEMKNAPKDSTNPFFKSGYADLASCFEVLRPVLSKHGLAITQTTDRDDKDNQLVLITTLMHESGEWIRGLYPIYSKDNSPQAIGSAVTYAKRYALQAITGLASDDDDGNAASTAVQGDTVRTQNNSRPAASVGHISDAQYDRLVKIAKAARWEMKDITEYLLQLGLKDAQNLNQLQYKTMCERILQYPKAGNGA